MAEIETHQQYCQYDKDRCEVCGFVATGGGDDDRDDHEQQHDCLRALSEYRRNMSPVLDRLRHELDLANDRICELQRHIDSYVQTIQNLTNLGKKKQLENEISVVLDVILIAF